MDGSLFNDGNSPRGTKMQRDVRVVSRWLRSRTFWIAAGAAAWVALISAVYLRMGHAAGVGKGVAELLQIGALPVT